MERIASFSVNHMTLLPGLYVSRRDTVGAEILTTFDIRMTRPNYEPVLNTAEIHTIEHLAATFLRNHEVFGSKIIYFGPMGCRTGFYLILAGDYESADIADLMKALYDYMANFEGDLPGASAVECGNYHDMNLPMAKLISRKFHDEVLCSLTEETLNYQDE